MILDWNGLGGRPIILDLLTYLPLSLSSYDLPTHLTSASPWDQLRETILEPLEDAMMTTHTDAKQDLVLFYTQLLRQWTVSLLAHQGAETMPNMDVLTPFLNYASVRAHTTLQSTTPTISLASIILDFYTAATAMHALLPTYRVQ